jgi:hypothetical protein
MTTWIPRSSSFSTRSVRQVHRTGNSRLPASRTSNRVQVSSTGATLPLNTGMAARALSAALRGGCAIRCALSGVRRRFWRKVRPPFLILCAWVMRSIHPFATAGDCAGRASRSCPLEAKNIPAERGRHGGIDVVKKVNPNGGMILIGNSYVLDEWRNREQNVPMGCTTTVLPLLWSPLNPNERSGGWHRIWYPIMS